MQRLKPICAIAVPVVLLMSGCGGGSNNGSGESAAVNDGQPETSVLPTNAVFASDTPLQTRLVTAFTNDQVVGWSCLAEDGFPFVYTFFDRQAVPGFESLLLGVRYDPLEEGGAPFSYRWAVTDGQTVQLDNPDGSQEILSNIEFVNPGDYLRVTTEDHGILYCQRQTGERA